MRTTATLQSLLTAAAIAGFGALGLAAPAHAQDTAAPADLSGTYQCQPQPSLCVWPGPTPSLSLTGTKAEIKNTQGETADAVMTSGTTISAGGPFNSLGIVRPDHSIDWSDGSTWRKQ